MSELVAVANVSEGTFEHREMTEEESKQDTKYRAEIKKQNNLEAANEAAKAEAKAAAEAKLVALGLDLDDLRALGL